MRAQKWIAGVLALAVAAGISGVCEAPLWAANDGPALLATAIDAYVYAYPLVLVDVTRRYIQKAAYIGNNQFSHGRSFGDASARAVVAPNNDFLNSTAWLDLSAEPIILHVPDFGSRYYLAPLMDGWTNVFASPGTRTTGNGSHDFVVTGPNWKGALPAQLTEIKSPTNMVWILPRIHSARTPDDVAAVRILQDLMTLTPLSSYGKPLVRINFNADPSMLLSKLPPEQVREMDGNAFFTYFANLLKSNPPAAADVPMVAKLASLGIVPGRNLDFDKLDPTIKDALSRAPIPGWVKVGSFRGGKRSNGWNISLNLGNYGTDYQFRAAVALFGLAANIPEDAVYPGTGTDGDGKPLTGSSRYVIHFSPGAAPPANAFWSLTLYSHDGFFVPNALNRYAIHSVDSLVYNDDGSLDLFIQADSPGTSKEANWLPAPRGGFRLSMRIYWPKAEVLEGKWQPPAVRRVGE